MRHSFSFANLLLAFEASFCRESARCRLASIRQGKRRQAPVIA
jgi:hypothetical protein